MGKKKHSSASGKITSFLIIMTVFLIYLIAARGSYGMESVKLTHYPHTQKNSILVCIEGEIHPTSQSYTITDVMDNRPTVNPFISINGDTHSFKDELSDPLVRQIDSLKLGCNNITFGSSGGSFTLELNYDIHYRPQIEFMEVKNLRAGRANRFFISSNINQEETKLEIQDVTRKKPRTLFNKSFEGSTVDITIEEPGNLLANAQIFDGIIWSDLYETTFSTHIISTFEQKQMTRMYHIPDDKPLDSPKTIPLAIKTDEGSGMKNLKRFLNGAYTLNWKLTNYVRWAIHNTNLKVEI